MATEMFRNGERELVEAELVPAMKAGGWGFEPAPVEVLAEHRQQPEPQQREEPVEQPIPQAAPVPQAAPIPGIPAAPAVAPAVTTTITQQTLDEMELSDIRVLARDNNIERWDTAQRKTLVEALLNAG